MRIARLLACVLLGMFLVFSVGACNTTAGKKVKKTFKQADQDLKKTHKELKRELREKLDD